MKLFNYLDTSRLAKLINEGYIEKTTNRDEDLVIFNYTRKTTFENLWEDCTIKCRGLIVSAKNGNLVARPREKFFNINTPTLPETQIMNLPDEEPEITEKLDGVAGTIYKKSNGVWAVATRGRFDSPPALFATHQLNTKYSKAKWPADHTPVVEIIWDKHPIICKYPFNDIVLTGLINIETGEELDYGILSDYATYNGMKVVELHQMELVEALTDVMEASDSHQNREGFVFTWHLAGHCSPLKIKVKFEEYKLVNKMLMGMTPQRVWEMSYEGKDFKPFDNLTIPEHLRLWIRKERIKLRVHYNKVQKELEDVLIHPLPDDRKAVAEYFDKFPELKGGLWMLYDKKSPAEFIYKVIRPKGKGSEALNIGI